MKFRKVLNYNLKIYMLISLLVSLILNTLTLFINKDITVHITIIINLLPLIMLFMFISYLVSSFSERKFYLHIVPISKRKLLIDMIVSFFISFILVWIIKIIFILLKIDIGLLMKNADIYGIALEWGLAFLSSLLLCLFILNVVLFFKIYLIRKLTWGVVIIILFFTPITHEKEIYKYESNIAVSNIDNNRVLEIDDFTTEHKVYYNYQLRYAVALLAILLFNIVKINKLDISD